MRTSKYVGKQFGNWKCIHIGIASVQGMKAKRPGHLGYYYIFQRNTSDGLAAKMIRLNANEAAKVYQNKVLVEDILEAREAKKPKAFTRKVSYNFY